MPNAGLLADYQAITALLTQYLEGGKQSDSQLMRPVFHELASIYTLNNNTELQGGPIELLFRHVDSSTPSPQAQTAIARIHIVGTVASARLESDGIAGQRFTDFFHLLKVDGQWTVIHKIYYSHPTS